MSVAEEQSIQPATSRRGPGRPSIRPPRINTLAARCKRELAKAEIEKKQADEIIASPEKATEYLARAVWDKYASRTLLELSKKGEKVGIKFMPYRVLQEVICGDRVLRAFMLSDIKGCSTEELGEKIVTIAALEGFDARTDVRWHYSESGEASPRKEITVQIGPLSPPKLTDEDLENVNEA
jgi:hypothetical protein